MLCRAAFQMFQIGRSMPMRSRQVFTERLDVIVPIEAWRHSVSTPEALIEKCRQAALEILAKAVED